MEHLFVGLFEISSLDKSCLLGKNLHWLSEPQEKPDFFLLTLHYESRIQMECYQKLRNSLTLQQCSIIGPVGYRLKTLWRHWHFIKITIYFGLSLATVLGNLWRQSIYCWSLFPHPRRLDWFRPVGPLIILGIITYVNVLSKPINVE